MWLGLLAVASGRGQDSACAVLLDQRDRMDMAVSQLAEWVAEHPERVADPADLACIHANIGSAQVYWAAAYAYTVGRGEALANAGADRIELTLYTPREVPAGGAGPHLAELTAMWMEGQGDGPGTYGLLIDGRPPQHFAAELTRRSASDGTCKPSSSPPAPCMRMLDDPYVLGSDAEKARSERAVREALARDAEEPIPYLLEIDVATRDPWVVSTKLTRNADNVSLGAHTLVVVFEPLEQWEPSPVPPAMTNRWLWAGAGAIAVGGAAVATTTALDSSGMSLAQWRTATGLNALGWGVLVGGPVAAVGAAWLTRDGEDL